ncbi:hypothetical protein Taro_034659 [Colocasia esculenta]|uniref:Disease resistance N-terminal domain-containing protein n=1 Tax=Colocasia esculenta TaxID=4460 RepID=A0A843WG56_COLES|nr:hypothetical protein [Colocasia esculenta]
MRSELEELESKIKEIQCLLADAEGWAFYSEAIRVWLKELKEVMYDADDIVDDCKVTGEIRAAGPVLSGPWEEIGKDQLSAGDDLQGEVSVPVDS